MSRSPRLRGVSLAVVVLAGVSLSMGVVTIVDTTLAVRAHPTCDVYCGSLTLVGAIAVLGLWIAAAVFTAVVGIVAIVLGGRTRIIGIISIGAVALPFAITLIEANTHVLTG